LSFLGAESTRGAFQKSVAFAAELSMADVKLDAFILFNERESIVEKIVDELG
jgi:hypothetical protein